MNNILIKPITIKVETLINDIYLPTLKNILTILKTDPKASQFLFPVNYQQLGLIDYTTIIHKPMDLETVENNLNNNKYDTIVSFLDDIQLIWSNCKKYNIEGSDIYKEAEYMEKLTDKNIKKYFIVPKSLNIFYFLGKILDEFQLLTDEDNFKEPQFLDGISFRNKISLTKKIKSLNAEKLTQVIIFILFS